MTEGRRAAIQAFHRGLGGPSWRVAGWGSAELQRARFEAMVRASGYQTGQQNGRQTGRQGGGSVLDWGCGPGDLWFHLGRPADYLGIDLDPAMVELARSRGVPARLGDEPPDGAGFDFVFASGIFQFADPADPLYYLTALEQAFDHCRRAVAATFLSDLRPDADRADDEVYVDPVVLVRFAAAVTGRWRLDHGYHPQAGDVTLALLRG